MRIDLRVPGVDPPQVAETVAVAPADLHDAQARESDDPLASGLRRGSGQRQPLLDHLGQHLGETSNRWAPHIPTRAKARKVAAQIAASEHGWGGDQFSCLNSLWNKESGWNYKAYNPSGATGIPQALPGSKMASFGTDWATNATTQIRWGLDYISRAYGTPCAAWGHSQSVNWY